MDDIISQLLKILGNTVIVHVYSYPHFSIEIFLAAVVCVVHLLLISEVNGLYRSANAKAAAKLRSRGVALKEVETCSYHSIARVRTQLLPQRIETTTTKQSYYMPPSVKKINGIFNNASNFGWIVTHGTSSMIRHSFHDRVDRILSITPSEYVRKDKERKSREEGLRTCIQSLTSLLEKALSCEGNLETNLSRETLRKSINAIRESFESHITGNEYHLAELKNSSLHSLFNKATMRKSLSPRHMLGVRLSASYHGKLERLDQRKLERKDSQSDFRDYRSCDSMQNYFTDKTIEVLHSQRMIASKAEG